jgi:hypothetical protein
MSETTPDAPQSTTLVNVAAALDRAKEIQIRHQRQVSFLIGLQTRLPILESALVYATKVHKETGEDITRLTAEISSAKKHIEQLTAWVARNITTPEDIEAATALAEKIKRLYKELEKKKDALHRLESGLPADTVDDTAPTISK